MLGEYGVLAPGGARVVVERLLDLAEGQALPEEVPSDPIPLLWCLLSPGKGCVVIVQSHATVRICCARFQAMQAVTPPAV